MSRRFAIRAALSLTACAALSPLSAALAYGNAGPTPSQVRAAVRRAERSTQLWATVNICDTPSHPNRIGIRGQMPALGFAAQLSISIQVEYWDLAASSFRPVSGPGGQAQLKLGTVRDGTEQGGRTFQFAPGAGLLRGRITFRWRLNGKLVGKVSRSTTAGHRKVAGGDPPGHSAASCTIS